MKKDRSKADRRDEGRSWPTAIDLFCGAGGLTTGLRQARFKVIGAVDVDPLAVKTYKLNHPRVRVWKRTIEKVTVTEVKRTLGIENRDLSLLAGCPPCEGFSSLRTLNGARKIKDPRNDLIYQFMRFVRGLKPLTVMLENVPALAEDSRIDDVCDELEELGYSYVLDVLDASKYGVPQRRRRMILLAGRLGSIEFAAEEAKSKSVRQAIGNLPGPNSSDDPLHKVSEARSDRIRELIRAIPKNGGSRLDLGTKKQLACHQTCDGFKDIYGRMAWAEVAPTITSGCVNPSKGRFLHPERNRAITLREAALLQTFPPDYKFALDRGKFAVASLIGNALPPLFVKLHAETLRSYVVDARS